VQVGNSPKRRRWRRRRTAGGVSWCCSRMAAAQHQRAKKKKTSESNDKKTYSASSTVQNPHAHCVHPYVHCGNHEKVVACSPTRAYPNTRILPFTSKEEA
jgi:hypothetical protein